MKRITLVVAAGLGVAMAAWAADAPRFRGPAGDGVFPETGLLKAWPEGGPKLAWSATGLGEGYSSAVEAGGIVYVTGRDDKGQGQLLAFGADGAAKWKVPYGEETAKRGPAAPGSRGTPTIDGDRVYVVSSLGRLVCMDAKTGKEQAAVDLVKQFEAQVLSFGNAESPLIDGENVICTPGGKDASVVALNKKDLKTVWRTKGLGEPSGYCSAVAITHGGKRLIVTVLYDSMVGIDAANGTVLWKVARTGRGVQPNQPVYADGMLYVTSSGRGGVAVALSADGASVKEVWTDKTLDNNMNGVVLLDGYIYGASQSKKALVCLGLKDGKIAWTDTDTGTGSIVAADGMLYVYGSGGTMYLVRADPKAFALAGKFTVTQGEGMHVAPPTIANGRMYIRHGGAMMAYDVKAAK
jgi:outer membrane protein assembly factor BamB